ncbi:hypothetical protein FGO68_gene1463 [Halteria grandinella]|uniref:RING-type domain-containing protein n=1 Tax=Halteria grandinella TaxID=5974 RepID=A0A8J8T0B6_HALGN|nr:hypothetical protein FGO68_gene1463 [Halteria grandinella]
MQNSSQAQELCSLDEECFIEDCNLWHVSYEDGKAPVKTKYRVQTQIIEQWPSIQKVKAKEQRQSSIVANNIGLIKILAAFYASKSIQMKQGLHADEAFNNVQILKNKIEEEVINATQKFCQICRSNVIEGEQNHIMNNCDHIFHQECIEPYLKNEIAEWKFPIKCPVCRVELDRKTDLEALLDDNMIELVKIRELEQGLMQMKGFTRCPTADCPQSFIYDDQQDDPDFQCTVCQMHYCLKCRKPYHPKLTCNENNKIQQLGKEEAGFKEFLKKENIRQCPFCQIFVQKQEGCSHVKCLCNNEFCFSCGGQYGDCECVRAVMDTSAFKTSRYADEL